MTNVNHNPSNDFPVGSLGMDNADDTEGHTKSSYLSEADEVHLEEADTEGHSKHSYVSEADEIHLEEADDTEGHTKS